MAPVAQDHLAAVGQRASMGRAAALRQHLDADGAARAVPSSPVVAMRQQQAADVRAGPDLQVVALLHRAQEGLGRVPAHAGALVDLEVAHAFVVAAVEVVAGRDAGLLRRLREGVEDLPAQALLLHAPLAAGALAGGIEAGRGVEGVGTLVEVLVLEGGGTRPSSQPGLPSAPQWS